MTLPDLIARVEAIDPRSRWNGPGCNPDGDIDDIRRAICDLRDCLAARLKQEMQDG